MTGQDAENKPLDPSRTGHYAINISHLPQVKWQEDQISMGRQEYILLYTIFLRSFMTERSMAVVDLSIVCDLNETFLCAGAPSSQFDDPRFSA